MDRTPKHQPKSSNARKPRLAHTQSAAPADATALFDQASALLPALVEREAAATAARDVPRETIADYHRAGILRVLQPRRFGGHQAPFDLFSRIVEKLAEACASSAWVYAVLGEHQWIIACMPEQAQIDVWGDDPRAVACSSLAPRETARRATGGWRLSGRFPFSSGSSHAQWAIIGARCPDVADNVATRYLLVPMREIEIIDDWHVLGLRATGSRTLLLQDMFVPAHRTVALRDLYDGTTPGARVHPDYDLLRAPRGFLVPFSLAPVGFPLGRRALALTAPALRTRLSRGMRRMADSEVVQLQLGEAGAAIEVATLVLHARRDESMAILRTDRAITDADILRNRRDITFALHELRRGVDRLVEISGARTVYDTDKLQMLARDLQAIMTHYTVSRHAAMVPYGRLLLGLAPEAGEA
jgi:alkylation response protein AidB-like acyl-CoA dehydrogenase